MEKYIVLKFFLNKIKGINRKNSKTIKYYLNNSKIANIFMNFDFYCILKEFLGLLIKQYELFLLCRLAEIIKIQVIIVISSDKCDLS